MDQAVAREIAEQVSPLVRKMRDGRDEMLCPRCENWYDVLAFKSMGTMEKYARHLNPVMKCGNCSHVFSPQFLSVIRVDQNGHHHIVGNPE